VISARTDVVQRAVALIGPDEHRRAECVNAVHVALAGLNASEADLRRIWDRNNKDGRRTAAQLEATIKKLLDLLDDPTAPNLHKQAETKPLLRLWQRRAGSMARDKVTPPFRFNAQKKLSAAAAAHNLLKRFDREISATEGSVFCQLAALLHGTPRPNFSRRAGRFSEIRSRY
jgi:hypothetical protein